MHLYGIPYPTKPEIVKISRICAAVYPILTQMLIVTNMSSSVNKFFKMFK